MFEILKSLFICETTAKYHDEIAKVEWKSIFTTNYDDVLEKAYSNVGRRLEPIQPSSGAKGKILSNAVCVHINGALQKAHVDDLDTNIKLSNSSYLTEAFDGSDWGFAFRKSLNLAKSIFFIGYSMYDLDIQRIIHNLGDLKEKTFFIEKEGIDPNEFEFGIQSDFGTVVPIGLPKFAEIVAQERDQYVPRTDSDTIFDFSKFEVLGDLPDFRDDRVFDLFLRGEIDPNLILASLRGDLPGPYFLKRALHQPAVEALSGNVRCLVVHSDMANGKTAFVAGLSCELIAKGYDVYELNAARADWASDLSILLARPDKVAIVVENANRYVECVKQFALSRKNSDVLICTMRTSMFDHKWAAMSVDFEQDEVFCADLDFLSGSDVNQISILMSTYKFWAARDALPEHRKISFIENDCNSQLSSVLLEIVKSPSVMKKFSDLMEEIATDSDVSTILVAASVLLILDYNIDNYILSELLPESKIYRINLSDKISFTEILNRHNGKFKFRSSIIAQFVLNQHPNSRELVDKLISICKQAHDRAEKHNDSDMFFSIYKSMVTFSVLQGLLPERGKRDALIRFYEGIKNLEAAKSHPHFWLQYAIARLANDGPDDLEKAKIFLDAAYARARNLHNYHTKHMDNTYARFLLKRAIVSDDLRLALSDFSAAHDILNRQAKLEKNHVAYRVARL